MSPADLLTLFLGQGGALVGASVVCVVLYRENKAYRARNEELQDARLKDAKDAEMLARAYLQLRQQDQRNSP